MATHEIIIAGFGGQGILSAGRLMAQAGIFLDYNVSWLPSYGPEMRGGTSNCHVVISDVPVGSPIINTATAIIVMNSPSLEKFEKMLCPGGIAILDSSLVDREPERSDITVVKIPATQIASDMGNLTYANIVLLGKLIKLTGAVTVESFKQSLETVLPVKYHHMIPEEMQALEKGADY